MSEEQLSLDEIGENTDTTEDVFNSVRIGPREIKLPTEWDVRDLNPEQGVTNRVTDGAHHSPNQSDSGEYYYATVSNMSSKGIDYKTCNLISEQEYEKMVAGDCKPKKGEVLFSKDGTVGLTSVFDGQEDVVLLSSIAMIDPDTDYLNSKYLSQYLSSWHTDFQIQSLKSGTAIRRVVLVDLEKLSVPLPPLPEQRKIATVLYTVDRAIEKVQELVNQTERVKAGLTQDILKKGIADQPMVETDSRFGLLPESWELRPLKEVSEIAGRTAPEKDDTECWGGDIPWVTPSEITSLVGQTIDTTDEYLTDLALEKVSSNLLPPMSVLMTTRATIGECAVNTVEMTTNQGFKNIIPGERLDTWYAYYRMEYEKDYLASLSKGSTFPEVGKDTVENFVIPIPPVEEQREIREILRSVDEQILSYKQGKSQYERLKQGLMQDLLSGTVRTTDTNIQVPDEVAQYG